MLHCLLRAPKYFHRLDFRLAFDTAVWRCSRYLGSTAYGLWLQRTSTGLQLYSELLLQHPDTPLPRHLPILPHAASRILLRDRIAALEEQQRGIYITNRYWRVQQRLSFVQPTLCAPAEVASLLTTFHLPTTTLLH